MTDLQIAAQFGIGAFYGEGEDRCAAKNFTRARAIECVRALRAGGYRASAVQGPELFAPWHVYCAGRA